MTGRVLRAAAGRVVSHVLVEPVRQGRLRPQGWPPGLAAGVGVAGIVCVAMVALTLLSGVVRQHSDLLYAAPTSTLPRWTVAVLLVGLVLALGCLYTGALHVRPLVRVPALVVVISVVTTVAQRQLDVALPALVGAGLLVVLALLRWRAAFAWWELVVATTVIGAALGCSLVLLQADVGAGDPSAALTGFEAATGTMFLLAEPFAVLAGATVAELLAATAVSVCAAAGQAVSSHASRVVVPVVLALLVLARALQVGQAVRGDDEYGAGLLLGGALVLAVPLAVLAPLVRTGHLRAWFGDADGEAGLAQWGRWGLLLAGLLIALVDGSVLLAQVSASFGLRGVSRWFFALNPDGPVLNPTTALSLALLGLAAFQRHRTGRWPLLLLVFAWVFAAQVIDTAFGLAASGAGALLLASVVAAGTALVLRLRGRLTVRRAVPLASVLLLTTLFDHRNAVTEPLTALLALTGVTVGLVVGVVWRLLTDLGAGNGDSARFPRSARVLLVVANATFGATGVALLALQGGVSIADLRRAESLGDSQLGFALVLAVVLMQLLSAWSPSDPAASRPAAPEPDRVMS